MGGRGHRPRDRVFDDRVDAGHALVEHIRALEAVSTTPLVLGLARGGVPVARVVADGLDADLDTLVVRKLGAPGHEEFAIGALTGGGHVVVNDDMPRRLGVGSEQFDALVARESRVLAEREHLYRGGRPPVSVAGREVILVDDGIATGSSMSVAIEAVRADGATRVVVAVPTAPSDAVSDMERTADAVVCVTSPDPFRAVGVSYRDFGQVDDDAVRSALQRP